MSASIEDVVADQTNADQPVRRVTAAGVFSGDFVLDSEYRPMILSFEATRRGISVKVVLGWRKYWLPASQIDGIGRYNGPMGSGFRVRHTVDAAPSLIAVLADLERIAPELRALGYRIIDDTEA